MAHSGFRRDRDATNSEAVEDYAKAIYTLALRTSDPVSTTALAERLGVSPGSVTAMLKRTGEMKLVRHEPYHGVALTAAGEKVALEVIRHHRLIESYLAEALGMPWDRVHDEAEVLEHYISEELETRIADALGEPSRDPHGDPIPGPELDLDAESSISLADLDPGRDATFTRVSDSDPEMLRFLDQHGIHPGARLRVIGVEPFGGAVRVEASGAEHSLGSGLAASIRVTPGPASG
jgi:DtxR family transcriptional regulator, Mn-dependent transcriptional regulator